MAIKPQPTLAKTIWVESLGQYFNVGTPITIMHEDAQGITVSVRGVPSYMVLDHDEVNKNGASTSAA